MKTSLTVGDAIVRAQVCPHCVQRLAIWPPAAFNLHIERHQENGYTMPANRRFCVRCGRVFENLARSKTCPECVERKRGDNWRKWIARKKTPKLLAGSIRLIGRDYCGTALISTVACFAAALLGGCSTPAAILTAIGRDNASFCFQLTVSGLPAGITPIIEGCRTNQPNSAIRKDKDGTLSIVHGWGETAVKVPEAKPETPPLSKE